MAQMVNEINVLEAQALAEIDALPEVISVEEVEARITCALWARWARLEAQIKTRLNEADKTAIDEIFVEECNRLDTGLAEIRDQLKEMDFARIDGQSRPIDK
jgi:uncharacterized small protein (DUF1192 family)